MWFWPPRQVTQSRKTVNLKNLLPSEPASYSFVLHFPTFNCLYNHCHWPVYPFLFLISLLSSFVVHFSFIPFSLSATFSLFVFVCLFVCVDGIGLGSSPTSSQNEALPPSTDWPVSAYTSSFSLSSQETDDAGTWFIHNAPLLTCTHMLTTQWLNHCKSVLSSSSFCCLNQSLDHIISRPSE